MADLHYDAIDYKRIFRNKEKRLRLISKLSFIPTKTYLKIVYWIKTGKRLHLKHPVTFTEKLNWLKVNDVHPEYTQLVDKVYMKKYISEKYGSVYVIPCLGVWDSYDEIDFDALPNKFVLKCNHDSGSVKVIHDKAKINHIELRKFFDGRLSMNSYYLSREYPYKDVPRKIFAEEFIETETGAYISDYKFFCFNGKVRVFYNVIDRNTIEKTSWYSRECEPLDIIDPTVLHTADGIPLPKEIDEMISFAEELATGKRFVRVDLYEANGHFFFGELTFFHCGGYAVLKPDKWEYLLGELIQI